MAMGNSRVPITIIICYRIKFHFLIRWPRNKLTGVVHFFFYCSHNYEIFLPHSRAYSISTSCSAFVARNYTLISPQRSSSVLFAVIMFIFLGWLFSQRSNQIESFLHYKYDVSHWNVVFRLCQEEHGSAVIAFVMLSIGCFSGSVRNWSDLHFQRYSAAIQKWIIVFATRPIIFAINNSQEGWSYKFQSAIEFKRNVKYKIAESLLSSDYSIPKLQARIRFIK